MYTVIYDPAHKGKINVVEDTLVSAFDATGLTTAANKIDPTKYGQNGTAASRVLYGAVEEVMYHEGITGMAGRPIILTDLVPARWFTFTGEKAVEIVAGANTTVTLTLMPDTTTSSFADVGDITVTNGDETIATGEITAVNGNEATLQLNGILAGEATVTVAFEDAELTFTVTVVAA